MMPRRRKARRQFETARKQSLGVPVPAQPRRDFRQHAQRGDVRGVFLQMGTQQCFRMRDLVLAQRRGGGEQALILGRGSDVLRIGGIGARRIARDVELIAKCAPRIRHVRLECHCVL